MSLNRIISLLVVCSWALAMQTGCAGDAGPALDDTFSPIDDTQVDGVQADWVRVDLNISTEHPYPPEQNETWQLEAPEQAQGIRLHFNAFETEREHDYFVLGDHVYHGALGEFTTNIAPGHLVPVQFITDKTVGHYGFDIDYYEYLMPHDALQPMGVALPERVYQKEKPALSLSLHQTKTQRTGEAGNPRASSFDDSHYDNLREHGLIHRCWHTLPRGITMSAPLTLSLPETLLFPALRGESAPRISNAKASLQRNIIPPVNLARRPLHMQMNFSRVNIGLNMRVTHIVRPEVPNPQQVVGQSVQSVRAGFGAWRAPALNRPTTHRASKPTLAGKPLNLFKNTAFTARSMGLKWENNQGKSLFKIKSIKI